LESFPRYPAREQDCRESALLASVGGDHSVSFPLISAFERHAPLTIVLFDAHLHYRERFLGLEHTNNSPFRRASELPFVKRIVTIVARGIRSTDLEYRECLSRWGFVPNYFEALGRDHQLLNDQFNLFTNAMSIERGLSKLIKEQIATVVSAINMSSDCLPTHLGILGRMDMDKSLCRKLSIDYKLVPLEPNVMELLELCEKLSIRPAKCNVPTSTICGGSIGLMPAFSMQSLLPLSTHVPSDSQLGSALRPTSTSAPSYLAS
jgi:Arginase family